MNNEGLDDNMIVTVDENGNEVKFEIEEIIEVDGKEYGILTPVGDFKEDTSVVMRLIENGDEFVFEQIEDDEEFQKVCDFINSDNEEE